MGAVALSQAGMGGADGSWAVLSGSPAYTPTQLQLYACEDQIRDSEQKHSTERVGYLVFE